MEFNGTMHFKETLGGVRTVAPLTPLGGELDSIATHYAWFGHGGLRTARTLSEMYEIPFLRRELGMLV